MANLQQAKKRARQTVKRTEVNHARKSRIRTYVRRARDACQGEDQNLARQEVLQAEREIMRGVTRGVMHRNTARRIVSKLSRRVRLMST